MTGGVEDAQSKDVKPKDVKPDSKEVKDALRSLEGLSEEQKKYVLDHLGQDVPPPQPPPTQPQPQNVPRLAMFSDQTSKDTVSYEIWKSEVRGLSNQYAEGLVMQAIRRSVRGRAAEVVLHEGDKGLNAVLEKMDGLFGNVLPVEQLMERFYIAEQGKSEDVATWACQLEDLIGKLKDRKAVSEEVGSSMIRTKFFTGLREEKMKNALRHKYDSHDNYSSLLIAARVAELESTPAAHQHVQQVEKSEKIQYDRVLKALDDIQNRLEKLETKDKEPSGRGARRGRQGRDEQQQFQNQQPQKQFQNQQPQQKQFQNQPPQQQFQNQQPQNQFQPQQQSQQPSQQQQPGDQAAGYQYSGYFNGNCYSCGGYGHRAKCCPLNLYPLASGASRQAGNPGPY